MNLFSRTNREDVPTIEVQGEEATIPRLEESNANEGKEKPETRVKLPKKVWGRT
jgi:hypothetical protein